MSRDIDHRADNLSPISRRAFFQGLGTKALKLGILGLAAASLGSEDEGGCTIYTDRLRLLRRRGAGLRALRRGVLRLRQLQRLFQ